MLKKRLLLAFFFNRKKMFAKNFQNEHFKNNFCFSFTTLNMDFFYGHVKTSYWLQTAFQPSIYLSPSRTMTAKFKLLGHLRKLPFLIAVYVNSTLFSQQISSYGATLPWEFRLALRGQLIWINFRGPIGRWECEFTYIGVKIWNEFITRGESFGRCAGLADLQVLSAVFFRFNVHRKKANEYHVDCYWLWQGLPAQFECWGVFCVAKLDNMLNSIWCKSQHGMCMHLKIFFILPQSINRLIIVLNLISKLDKLRLQI